MNYDAEYEVEEILSVRLRYKKLQYQAKWSGYSKDLDWYPASNFMYSPYLLREFHLKYSELPGPPARLEEWIRAFEDGVEDYDNLEDDKPMSESSRTSFFQKGG